MNSSIFLAVASAALFVLVFQGGEAADVILQKILRSKRDACNDMKWLHYNTTRLIGGKINCVLTKTRDDYTVVPDIGAYKIHTRRMTWFDAQATCLVEGGHLAVMDSSQKRDLFQKYKEERNNMTLWLGFHDLFVEGSWVTTTGESIHSISFNPWADDQPNNYGDQDCAILYRYGMADEKCTKTSRFICEINLCEALGHRVYDSINDSTCVSSEDYE